MPLEENKPARGASDPSPVSWWVKVLLLVFAVGLFAVVELVLQIADYGDTTELFIPRTRWDGAKVRTWNHRSHHRYFNYSYSLTESLYPFSRESSWGIETQEEFLEEKPEKGIRVFCIGSSSVRGFPLGKGYSFGVILDKMLKRSSPYSTIEVLNPTNDALSSTIIRQLFEEAVVYDPDLMVIYFGHNEFYGVGGTASTKLPGMWGWPGHILTALQRVKIYRCLKDGHQWFRDYGEKLRLKAKGKTLADEPPPPLMDTLPGVRNVPPGGRLSRNALTRFRTNLMSMMETARRRGVHVLLMTVDSNLFDLYPLRSQPREEIPETNRFKWQKLLDRGRKYWLEEMPDDAVIKLRKAVTLAPYHAETAYLLGRALIDTGQVREGVKFLRRSRDLDRVPFRARAEINAVIRTVAQKYQEEEFMHFVDVERLFSENAENAVPGRDLFLEHVHFTFKGKFLVAREIMNAISRSPLGEKWGIDLSRIPMKQAYYEKYFGYGPSEEMSEINFIMTLYNAFPIQDQYDIIAKREVEKTRWLSLKSTLPGPMAMAQSRTEKSLPSDVKRWSVRLDAAHIWEGMGEPQKALKLQESVAREAPRLWFSHANMGRLLVKMDLPGRAVESLKKAIYLHDQFGWTEEVLDFLRSKGMVEVDRECAYLAEAYAAMGYKEDTIQWLREAAHRGFTGWDYIMQGPVGRYIVEDKSTLMRIVNER